jgi:hypothetical protein
MPEAIMAADPQRARLLADHAVRAGCGAESAEGVCVYAASVEHLHAMAEIIFASQAEMDRLAPPSWRPRVQEYLDCEDLMSSNGPMTRLTSTSSGRTVGR